MDIDWEYPAGAGTEGIYEIGRRLSEGLGRLPDATTFVQDAREMLRITRQVEREARGGTLVVGFQVASKLDVEVERYRDIVDAGTQTVVFAAGRPSEDIEGLEYREVKPGTRRLENQWFLVSDDPEPIGFVSWEVSDPQLFGVGGALTEGKRFVGFISDDADVVAELMTVLQGTPGITPPAPPKPAGPGPRARRLIDEANRIEPSPTGAADGAVILSVGRSDDDDAAITLGLAIAREEGRRLVIVDRVSEGILFGESPYSDLRGDDELRPKKDELFSSGMARREGRSTTAAAIEAAASLGIDGGGWFPTSAGADGLGAAIERFGGALLVLPGSIASPSIGERLRGMTVGSLERFEVPLVLAG